VLAARCPVVCTRLSHRPSAALPALQELLYQSLHALVAFESVTPGSLPPSSSSRAGCPSPATHPVRALRCAPPAGRRRQPALASRWRGACGPTPGAGISGQDGSRVGGRGRWKRPCDFPIPACGAWALRELQRLCQMAKAPPNGGEWRAWYARLCKLINQYHERSDKAVRFTRRLLREMDSLWVFLSHHGVEPTNNRGERALRFGVQWRKRSLGTASDKGNRWVERILSLKETCRPRGIDLSCAGRCRQQLLLWAAARSRLASVALKIRDSTL
jgi:hypothetical protein